MIPAVIDTNVFISALLAGRTPLAVIETAQTGQTLLLISSEIVAEIERTLGRPKFARTFQKSGTNPFINFSRF
jgi:putative PIN family toxin of toxin-antitoxin system